MKRVIVLGPLLSLAACAGLPENLGHDEVANQVRAQGREVPSETPAARAALMQSLQAQPLTVAIAVQIALLNHPKLQSDYARLGLAAADVYDAGRLANPSLSASLMIPDAAGLQNQVTFGLVQRFTDLLLLSARSRWAEYEFARVQQDVSARILALAGDVEAAYYRLAGAVQLQKMREQQSKAAQTSAELAQRYHDAGNLDALELVLEQAAAAQARIEVEQARATTTQARSSLNQLMGLNAAADRWLLPEGLPPPPSQEDDLQTLLGLAERSRLDLAAARGRVSALADQLGVTRRFRALGALELGVETERGTDGVRSTGPTLSVELPIFNQGEGRAARAAAQLQQAEASLRELELTIGNTVRRSSDALAAARTRLQQYRESLIPLREAAVARLQEQVNYMLKGPFGLLLAKQQVYAAYTGYLEALRDYWTLRAELAREVGAPLPSAARMSGPDVSVEALISPATGEAEPVSPPHLHGDHP